MKKHIKKIVSHPLISGGSIIFIGSFLAYFIHYIFNLVMGRILPPAEYGLITSLVSLTILFAVFQTSLTGVFAKFSAKFRAAEDYNGLSALFRKGFIFTGLVSGVLLLILVLSTNLLINFLHISNYPILFLTFFYITISILSSLPNGMLQGEVRVVFFSFIGIGTAALKIILGVSLVLLGFGAFGAMLGIVIAGFIPYLISILTIFFETAKYKSGKVSEKSLFTQEFKGYTFGFFLATLGITVFTSVDIILARHFFPPVMAGQYSALSLMGKAIFYFTFPILFVFFPLVAQKKEKKEPVYGLLLFAALIIAVISASASAVYFLMPGLVLAIFFPSPDYKILAPYLGPFSLFILVFSLANLLSSFLLSIGKTQIFALNMFCGIMLVVLYSFFHATIFQVIGVMFSSSLLLLILLLCYLLFFSKEKMTIKSDK